jgi:multicomponent Na+:H+ antiporter subunit B
MLAFGKGVATSKITRTIASNLESVGALIFLLIALSGFLGGTFFMNILGKGTPFKLFSAGTIPLYNYAIGLKVGVGLFAIYLAFVILEKVRKGK